jgi:hypothetical protein
MTPITLPAIEIAPPTQTRHRAMVYPAKKILSKITTFSIRVIRILNITI